MGKRLGEFMCINTTLKLGEGIQESVVGRIFKNALKFKFVEKERTQDSISGLKGTNDSK
jgi:hypothetical protein